MYQVMVRARGYTRDHLVPHVIENKLFFFIKGIYKKEAYMWAQMDEDAERKLDELAYKKKEESNKALYGVHDIFIIEDDDPDDLVIDQDKMLWREQMFRVMIEYKMPLERDDKMVEFIKENDPEYYKDVMMQKPVEREITIAHSAIRSSQATPYVDGKTLNFFLNPRIYNVNGMMMETDEMEKHIDAALIRLRKSSKGHWRWIEQKCVLSFPDDSVREECEYWEIKKYALTLITVKYDDDFDSMT